MVWAFRVSKHGQGLEVRACHNIPRMLTQHLGLLACCRIASTTVLTDLVIQAGTRPLGSHGMQLLAARCQCGLQPLQGDAQLQCNACKT
jgi:hypothetical protein